MAVVVLPLALLGGRRRAPLLRLLAVRRIAALLRRGQWRRAIARRALVVAPATKLLLRWRRRLVVIRTAAATTATVLPLRLMWRRYRGGLLVVLCLRRGGAVAPWRRLTPLPLLWLRGQRRVAIRPRASRGILQVGIRLVLGRRGRRVGRRRWGGRSVGGLWLVRQGWVAGRGRRRG